MKESSTQFHTPSPVNTPEIYNLIRDGATVAEISMQLYKDYSTERDPEKAYLAIRELLDRGFEGRAALMQMAHGSDELSLKIAEIINSGDIEGEVLEKILGVKRFGEVFVGEPDDTTAKKLYDHVVKTGQFSLDFNSFDYEIAKDEAAQDMAPAQLNGYLDQAIVNHSQTFGVSEPGYLELFGAKELLRQHTLANQQMLLLGSYGVYSAREFRKFAEKITGAPDTFVIDVDGLCVNQMLADRGVNNRVMCADAREMPFESGTMDQIFTNHLLHFLDEEDYRIDSDADIANLIKETARVLKPGGFFVLSEMPFGEHKGKDRWNYHQMLYDLVLLAKKFGLEVVQSSTVNLRYFLRKELGSATIDPNGFPHYENSLIKTDRGSAIRVRFVKK